MSLSSRSSGLLAHITSLNGMFGSGDLGPEAYRFVDRLSRTGQTFWQMLPIGPTGYGNSPYQTFSSFAGNPLFISFEQLQAEGLLHAHELHDPPPNSDFLDYDRVFAWREPRLRHAFDRFTERGSQHDHHYQQFLSTHAWWLNDYALFQALKHHFQGAGWNHWPENLIRREPRALEEQRSRLAKEVSYECFLQYEFDKQWQALQKYARDRGIQLFGDVAIFTAHDSADVWSNQELFFLDAVGNPTVIAGVPPDYFSATGQRWGNPLYRWDYHAQTGYRWWIARLRRAFELFDLVRIDHFRGFESYWEIPADAPDARPGHWVKGPGVALFREAEKALGKLAVVAEDLGLITQAVDDLREETGFPGMRVLQFAFGDDPKKSIYLPHNFSRNCVVYTGTHDNDTTVGWFRCATGGGGHGMDDHAIRERQFALEYMQSNGELVQWDLIRLAWQSVAVLAIAPLQDVLGLDSPARMNTPGCAAGNWAWRFNLTDWTPEVEALLRRYTCNYGRENRR